jgi:hypothetical protein
MHPEIGLLILVIALIAIMPFVLLGFLLAVMRRQEDDFQSLSRSLERLERAQGQMREMLKKLSGAEETTAPQAKAEPPAATAASKKPAEAPAAVFVPKDASVEKPIPPRPIVAAQEAKQAVEKEHQEKPAAEKLVWWSDQQQQPAARKSETPPALPPAPPPPDWTPPPPREPSRFEIAAKETLRKIGRWILIGEDELKDGVTLESAIASNWLMRIGVLVIVMAVGYTLMLSIDKGWLDRVGQVMLGTVAGLGLLVAGTRMLGQRYHLIGQGLVGAGIASLYLCVYAAHSYCKPAIIDNITAFALMIGVTCLAGWIATRFNSLLVAVLGVLGGFGTPIMLQTGEVAYVSLYTYLLVLGAGVLAVSYRRKWHLLNYLSFIGSYGLMLGTMSKWHYSLAEFWKVMPFLIGFFVLFSTMTFLFNVVNRKKSNLLDVLGLWMNAGVFFGVGLWMVRGRFDDRWGAALSLGLAAFYAAHVWYFLVRRLMDRELLMSFTAMSAFFLAVTMPIVLSSEWITPCWAVQALVMLWLAGKLDSEFLRQVSYLLYAITLARFGFVDLRHQYYEIAPAAMSLSTGEYLKLMLERLVIFGTPIASLAGAGWLVRHNPPRAMLTVGRDNDMRPWLTPGGATLGILVAVLGMGFLVLHYEFHRSLGFFYPPLQQPAMTLLWAAMCGFLLSRYLARPNIYLLMLLFLFAAGMVGKLFFFDLQVWDARLDMLYGAKGSYDFGFAAMRLLDFGAMIAMLTFCWRLLRGLAGNEDARSAGIVFGAASLAMLFVFTTFELNTFLRDFVPGLRAGGISILWSLFALGLIVGGMWRDVRAVRYAGLVLFAVVAGKVLLSDTAHLSQVYRIVAFVILGVLMLSGSFAYLKCRPMIEAIKKQLNKEQGP